MSGITVKGETSRDQHDAVASPHDLMFSDGSTAGIPKNRSGKVFKSTLAAGGFIVVSALIVGSVASWTDSGTIFSEFSSAPFEVEYATGERDSDGELIWFSGDGSSDLLFELHLDFDGDDFSVGDVQSDAFYVRVVDNDDDADNANDDADYAGSAAVLWLDDVEASGQAAEGLSYEFVVGNDVVGSEDEDASGGSVVASGGSLDVISENNPVGLYADEETAVSIVVTGTPELPESSEASVEWTVAIQETSAYEAGVRDIEVDDVDDDDASIVGDASTDDNDDGNDDTDGEQ